jgi:hypothetical protein
MAETTDARVADLETRMNAISKKFRGDGKATIFFIVIIFVGIGYFWYGFSKIAPAAEPKELVSLLAGPIDNGMTELRVNLTNELIAAAPGFAEDLSVQAIQGMPSAREVLEEHIVAQLETEIETLVATGETEFVKVLQDNREEFEKTLEDLADNQDASDTTVKIFFDAIKAEMGQDMHDQAELVLGTLIALREKAETLKAGSDLTFVSDMERRILMTARRLQLQEADPEFIARKEKAAEAKKKALEEEEEARKAAAAAAEKDASKDDPKKDADKDDDKKDDAKKDEDKKDEAK